MPRKNQQYEVGVTVEDGAVVAAGSVVATSTWWWDLLIWIPEFIKFLGLVATVIFLIFRAVNEVEKYLEKRKRT